MNVLLKTNLNVNGLCYFLLGILFFDFKMAFFVNIFCLAQGKKFEFRNKFKTL